MASMGLLRYGCGLLRLVYHGSSGGPWLMSYEFWIWVDLGVTELGVDLGVDRRFWIWVLILDLGSV